MLEAVKGWSSWSISSPFSKCSGWKASILSVLLHSKPVKILDPVQPEESSLCFSIRIHQAAGWCSAGQLESFLERSTRGTTCTLPFLFLFFLFVLYESLQSSLYIDIFSSELEKIKILEYMHWNIAESLAVEWRTQQTWRTMKISSKEVTSTHTVWGQSTSSVLQFVLCGEANSRLLSYCADFNMSEEMW